VNKLDVLAGLPELRVCTHYEIDGQLVDTMPDDPRALRRARPRYQTLPGWPELAPGARAFAELPDAARAYVDRVAELVGLPVVSVGVGPRNQDILSVAEGTR
jgi:adenylosuccinate synthase